MIKLFQVKGRKDRVPAKSLLTSYILSSSNPISLGTRQSFALHTVAVLVNEEILAVHFYE